MPPRGRGRGGTTAGNRVATASAQGTDARTTAQNVQQTQAGKVSKNAATGHCGLCEVAVDDSAIGCDRCTAWFCPSETCTGLPESAIALISLLREENSVLFVCTGCRVNPGSGAWTEAPSTSTRSKKRGGEENEATSLKQLYMTVKGLSSEMAKLTAKLDAAIVQGSLNSVSPSVPPSQSLPERSTPTQTPSLSQQDFPAVSSGTSRDKVPANLSYRSAIRQEVIEVREREKRRSSVIIKGLKAKTPDAIASEFAELTSVMMGCRVTLSDIIKIKDHPELCRAKIMSNDQRVLVLDKAKTLKDSQYDHVYIRRDLTFTQRQELKMRREHTTTRVFSASIPRPQVTVNHSEVDAPQAAASSQDVPGRDPPAEPPTEPADPSDSAGVNDQGATADRREVGSTVPTTQAN